MKDLYTQILELTDQDRESLITYFETLKTLNSEALLPSVRE